MAEAIGAGASVIAFVGIAGQLAQGCQNAQAIFDGIKDASGDLRSLHTEVKIFQLTLETFGNILEEVADSGIVVEEKGQALATQLALQYSEEAIEQLLALLAKKNSKHIWGKIRFAIGKDKCAKHVGRMERAKGYILTAQASILLSLEHQQTLNTRATHRSVSALTSNLDISSTTVATLPSRFDEVRSITKTTQQTVGQLRGEFSQRLQDLSTGINAILTSNFTAFTSMISETRNRVEEVYHSTQDTHAAVQSLRMSEGIKWLPMGMEEMVKDTFRDVLVGFYHERAILQDQVVEQRDAIGRQKLASHCQSARRVISQHTLTRTYIRTIGIIAVHSITTTFCERDHPETDHSITSTVTQTNVELNPNPELLRVGVYCSIVQQGFAAFDSPPEPKLRVFNVVDTDAMIVKACTAGDLFTVRSLFASGRASPFDRIWGDRSLLDLILMQVISTASSQLPPASSHQRLHGLVATYSELVRCGLDPGIPRTNIDIYGMSPLSALATLRVVSPEHSCYIINLARVILANSIHDPLLGADVEQLVWKEQVAMLKTPLYELLRTQEEWPISWPSVDQVVSYSCSRLSTSFDRDVEYDPFGGRRYSLEILKWIEFGELCYIKDPSTFRQLLQVCKNVRQSLAILDRIVFLYEDQHRPGGQKLDKESIDRLGGMLRESLISYLENGPDINNPPPRFLHILKDFRQMGAIQTIGSALSSLGLGTEVVNDLLESELYCCMVYQLDNLSFSSLSRPDILVYIPRELGYTISLPHNFWSAYLEKISVNVSNEDMPDEHILEEDILKEDISEEDISEEDISEEDMSEGDISEDDTSHEDVSDEDMSVGGASGEPMLHLDACSPKDFGLAVEGVQMTAWPWQDIDRNVSSAPVRSLDLNRESKRPAKWTRHSTYLVEEVRDEDDASSTMSSLLDAFDAEYHDDFQHKQNSIQGNLTTPIVSEIITICNPRTSATVNDTEEDMDSDDSGDERLDGLTIALNAFWT